MTTPAPDPSLEALLAEMDAPPAPKPRTPAPTPTPKPSAAKRAAPPTLDDAPTDGTRVWLRDEHGAYVEAYWRKTRRRGEGIWVNTAFWALWGSNIPVPFEPASWAPYV